MARTFLIHHRQQQSAGLSQSFFQRILRDLCEPALGLQRPCCAIPAQHRNEPDPNRFLKLLGQLQKFLVELIDVLRHVSAENPMAGDTAAAPMSERKQEVFSGPAVVMLQHVPLDPCAPTTHLAFQRASQYPLVSDGHASTLIRYSSACSVLVTYGTPYSSHNSACAFCRLSSFGSPFLFAGRFTSINTHMFTGHVARLTSKSHGLPMCSTEKCSARSSSTICCVT